MGRKIPEILRKLRRNMARGRHRLVGSGRAVGSLPSPTGGVWQHRRTRHPPALPTNATLHCGGGRGGDETHRWLSGQVRPLDCGKPDGAPAQTLHQRTFAHPEGEVRQDARHAPHQPRCSGQLRFPQGAYAGALHHQWRQVRGHGGGGIERLRSFYRTQRHGDTEGLFFDIRTSVPLCLCVLNPQMHSKKAGISCSSEHLSLYLQAYSHNKN